MPAAIKRIDHAGVRCFDVAESHKSWCDALGMKTHPTKQNWLCSPDNPDYHLIHLMPTKAGASVAEAGSLDPAVHVALEVDSLQDIAHTLLAGGFKPFQTTLDPNERHYITDQSDDLDFGIGTVFVLDPAGNWIEFINRHAGIFQKLVKQ